MRERKNYLKNAITAIYPLYDKTSEKTDLSQFYLKQCGQILHFCLSQIYLKKLIFIGLVWTWLKIAI